MLNITLALYKPTGELAEVIGTIDRISMFSSNVRTFTFNSPSINSPAGTYLLRLSQKSITADEKKKVKDYSSYKNDMEVIVNGGGVDIRLQNSLSSSATSVDRGEIFTVSAQFKNSGTSIFSGDLGVALVNDAAAVLEVIGIFRTDISLDPGSSLNELNASCSVSAAIPTGNYKIRAIAKPAGEAWSIIYKEADVHEAEVIDRISIGVTNEEFTHNVRLMNSLSSSVASVDRGEVFTVTTEFRNERTNAFSGDLGVALVNDNDDILEIIGISGTNISLNAGSVHAFSSTSCVISIAIPAGDYKIRAVAKPVGESWSIVYREIDNIREVIDIFPLTVTSGIIEDNNNLVLNSDFSIDPDPLEQFSPVAISIRVLNQGSHYYHGSFELALYEPSGELAEVIGTIDRASIRNSGYSETYTFNSALINSPAGTYLLRLSQKSVTDSEKKKVEDGSSYKNDKEITVGGIDILPRIVSISPARASSNVPLSGEIVITFDRAMDPAAGNVRLRSGIVNMEEKSWSEGNTVFTVSYRGLTFFLTCSMEVSEFQDVSGNTIETIDESSHIFSTRNLTTTNWLTESVSTDWNDPANWSNGIPDENSMVGIPRNAAFYPILTEDDNAIVGNISFSPGAEIGNQHLLTYTKVFVNYDFGIGDRSTHFRMLSLPLMEAYPGDFTFGGYPDTYFQTFEETGGKGKWVTAAGGNTGALSAGTGFVLSIDPDGPEAMGLKMFGGNLRLPFFDSDSMEDLVAVHPNHTYDLTTGISTFTNPYGAGSYSVYRSEDAYRLAGEGTIVAPEFGKSGSSTLALIGNPFMTTIDFDKFYMTNSILIKNNYRIWTKVGRSEGYAGYSPEGNWGLVLTPALNQAIVPLQGFIVEYAGYNPESFSEFVKFDLLNISATGASASLRSSASQENKLEIVARNEAAAVLSFIAKREYGSVEFAVNDARKLINSVTEVPEIYTLKASSNTVKAVGANITDSDNVEYPLGLSTSFAGEISFTFTGMADYDARIFFIDNATDREIELTDLDTYTYSFNYTPSQKDGVVLAVDDRFSIRFISKSASNIFSSSAYILNIYAEEGFIHAVSYGSDPIRQIKVYNLQGEPVYHKELNEKSHTTGKFAPGVYIVRIKTENEVKTQKIIIH